MSSWFARRPVATVPRRTTTISVHLGRTSLAQLRSQVQRFLIDDDCRVVLSITGYDYFSQDTLGELTSIVDSSSGRVSLRGLDDYADALLPDAGTIDLRDQAQRAVTTLHTTVIVTVANAGRMLTKTELAHALELAVDTGLPIVTVDFRHIDELTPAIQLELAELSAVLVRLARTLLIVNANGRVASQIKAAGLSGSLHMGVEDI
jgi:hypothetical protein